MFLTSFPFYQSCGQNNFQSEMALPIPLTIGRRHPMKKPFSIINGVILIAAGSTRFSVNTIFPPEALKSTVGRLSSRLGRSTTKRPKMAGRVKNGTNHHASDYIGRLSMCQDSQKARFCDSDTMWHRSTVRL